MREKIVELALNEPDLSPREVAVAFTDRNHSFVSESSVYRLLKAHGLITSPAFIVMKAADTFQNPTTAPNQLWQTDFTYLKIVRWGWFFLSTVLDDFSRYIVAWKLCTGMAASDVTDTLELALQASGLDDVSVKHRPRLLSDNGPSYIASDLSKWLDDHDMKHTRGRPYHPMTQGKIERWHLSLKSRILLENYYLPGDLERAVADFVDHYNHRRNHERMTADTTRASTTSRRLTSTSDTVNAFWTCERRSNAVPSSNAAKTTSKRQHEQQSGGPEALLN